MRSCLVTSLAAEAPCCALPASTILGGGAEITQNPDGFYALEMSNPSGQIGWTAFATLVEDHDAVVSEFDVVHPVPNIEDLGNLRDDLVARGVTTR